MSSGHKMVLNAALAQAMLPVNQALARAAFAQAYEVAQKIAVIYK